MSEVKNLFLVEEKSIFEKANLCLQSRGYPFNLYIKGNIDIIRSNIKEYCLPHIHISDNGRELGRVVIPKERPESIKDIIFLKEDYPIIISDTLKKLY